MDPEVLIPQMNTMVTSFDDENVNLSDKISTRKEKVTTQTKCEDTKSQLVNKIIKETVGSLLVVKYSRKPPESESEDEADEDVYYAPHELELHGILNKFNYNKSDSDRSSSESELDDNIPLAKIQKPLCTTLDNSKNMKKLNQEVLSKFEKKPIVYLKRLEDLKVFVYNVKKLNPSYCLKRVVQESKPKLTNIKEIDRSIKKDKKTFIMVCNKINEMNRGDKNSLDALINSCFTHDHNEASNIVDLTDEPDDTKAEIIIARPSPRIIQLVSRNEIDTYFVNPNGKILSQSNINTQAQKFVDIVNELLAKIYICCWYKREKKLKELLDKKLISYISYTFMRKKHNCKLNFACICCLNCKTNYLIRPKVANRIILSTEPTTFLKSNPLAEKPEIIICDDDIKPDVSECTENSFISNSINYMKSRDRICENNNELLTFKTVNVTEGIKSHYSESYELRPKGDIKEYNVKKSSPVENTLDCSEVNKPKPNVDYDICCWNKRELVIQRMIASNAPLSTILFLKRKHLCPNGNCRCCCQQVPQRYYNCKAGSEKIRPMMEQNKSTLITDKPKCEKEIDHIPRTESVQDIDKEIKRLLGLRLKHSANGYAKKGKNNKERKNCDDIDKSNLEKRIDSLFNCISKEIDDESQNPYQYKQPAKTSNVIYLKERDVTEALSSSSNENAHVEVSSKISSDTLVNAVIHDLLGGNRFVKPVARPTFHQNDNLNESLKKAMDSIEGFNLIINKKRQVKAQMKIPASELSPDEISLLNSVIKMSQELVVKHNIKTISQLKTLIGSSAPDSDKTSQRNSEQHISVIKFNHTPNINVGNGTITILPPSVLNKLSAAVQNKESEIKSNLLVKATGPPLTVPMLPTVRMGMGIGLSQVKTTSTTTITQMPGINAKNGTITILPQSVLNKLSCVQNTESEVNYNILRTNKTIREEPAATTSASAPSTAMPLLPKLRTDMCIGLSQVKTTPTTTTTHMPGINAKNGTITIFPPSVLNKLSVVQNTESEMNCNILRTNKTIREEPAASTSATVPSTSINMLPTVRTDMVLGFSQLKPTTTTSINVPLISVRKDMGIPLSQMKPTVSTSTILPSICNPRISTISPPPLINFTPVAPNLEMTPKIVSVQSMKENVNNNQPNTSSAKIAPSAIDLNIDNIRNGSQNNIPTYTITINDETQNLNILEKPTVKRKASVRKGNNNGGPLAKKRILNHDLR